MVPSVYILLIQYNPKMIPSSSFLSKYYFQELMFNLWIVRFRQSKILGSETSCKKHTAQTSGACIHLNDVLLVWIEVGSTTILEQFGTKSFESLCRRLFFHSSLNGFLANSKVVMSEVRNIIICKITIKIKKWSVTCLYIGTTQIA